jgi:hypothetical protein
MFMFFMASVAQVLGLLKERHGKESHGPIPGTEDSTNTKSVNISVSL